MSQSAIDKELKIPLIYQIYEDLLSKIVNGEYKAGDKLPSETELMKHYNVSRITVRGAMKELEKDSRIQKFRGIGTLVCTPKRKYDLQRLTSFSTDVRGFGEKSSSVLLAFDLLRPSPKIAEALQLEADEKVYYIERKRLRGDFIAGLNCAYLKRVNALELSAADFTTYSSLYLILESKGVILKRAEELIEARLPRAELAKKLDINKHQPVFYRERISYGPLDEPVEYVEMYYRSDVYQCKIALELEDSSMK